MAKRTIDETSQSIRSANKKRRVIDSEPPCPPAPPAPAAPAPAPTPTSTVAVTATAVPLSSPSPSPPGTNSNASANSQLSQPHGPNHELVKLFRETDDNKVELKREVATGTLFVVKTLVVDARLRSIEGKDCPLEVNLIKNLPKHPNVCPIWDIVVGKNEVQFSIEYCSGGDLDAFHDHWFDTHGPMESVPPIFVCHCIASLIDAMAFIHEGMLPKTSKDPNTKVTGHLPIIHRDIKPANVFLRWPSKTREGMPQVVLGDFGMVCLESESRSWCGTPAFMSPEGLRAMRRSIKRKESRSDRILTSASDVYSFAKTIIALIKNTELNEDLAFKQGFRAWSNAPVEKDVQELLGQCTAYVERHRPTSRRLWDEDAPKYKKLIAEAQAAGETMPPGSWVQCVYESSQPSKSPDAPESRDETTVKAGSSQTEQSSSESSQESPLPEVDPSGAFDMKDLMEALEGWNR